MKSYIKSAIFAFAAAGLFTACSSDSNEPNIPDNSDFEGIELAIPTKFLSTRADETIDPTTEEATINTLTVIAYDATKDASANTVAIKALTLNGSDLDDSSSPIYDDYSTIPFRIGAGTYRIYLFANVDKDNLETTNGTTKDFDKYSENEIRSLKLKNLTLVQDEALTAETRTYLPMSCWYETLHSTTTPTSTFTDGKITVTKSAKTTVYADLTLAVAKLRVTIYNTKSKGMLLATTDGVKFTKMANVESAFDKNNMKATDASVEGAATGSYYNLPSNWTDLTNEAQWAAVNVDNKGSEFTATTNDLWMWQSSVYVAERLYDTGTEKSKIDINFSNSKNKSAELDGTKTGETAVGIERGTLYDLIAYVDTKEVNLQVRVKPWGYHKYVYDLE